jgi:D-isomer specific 2-hydroxyacid dehydrogenase, catalytic domain
VSEKIVLVTDHTWPSVEPEGHVLARVGARIVEAESGEEAELLDLVADADAILTCFAKVSANVIRAGKRLQVVGRYGIGVDNIAVDEATRLGIPVTNVPAYCLDEVAEHALALLLSLARKTCAYDAAVRRGEWTLATGAPIFRIAGRTPPPLFRIAGRTPPPLGDGPLLRGGLRGHAPVTKQKKSEPGRLEDDVIGALEREAKRGNAQVARELPCAWLAEQRERAPPRVENLDEELRRGCYAGFLQKERQIALQKRRKRRAQ